MRECRSYGSVEGVMSNHLIPTPTLGFVVEQQTSYGIGNAFVLVAALLLCGAAFQAAAGLQPGVFRESLALTEFV